MLIVENSDAYCPYASAYFLSTQRKKQLQPKNFIEKIATAELMMNTSEKTYKYHSPLWQSDKMRNIIEDRWEEVWKIVIARDIHPGKLHQYLKNPKRNLDF